MNYIDFIVSPIVGSIIGYFTNWLAIKMLFKPYEEKRLFGIKLPFTPGLIPKGRFDLSKKVANTVSEHLITKEVLTNSLKSKEVEENISKIIMKFVEDFKSKEHTVDDVLTYVFKDDKCIYNEKVKKYIRTSLEKEIFNESNVEAISENILKYLLEAADKETEFFNKAILKIKNISVDLTKEYLNNPKTKESLKRKIFMQYEEFLLKDQQIKELIPESFILKIKEVLDERMILLPVFIEKLLEENPIIDENLKKLTSNIIDDNFGRIAGAFINHNKVYLNIKNGLIEYLSQKENREQLTLKLLEKTNEFLDNKIEVIDKKITYEMKTAIFEKIFFYIENNFNIVDDISNYFVDKVTNKKIDIISVLTKIQPDIKEKIKDFIKLKINTTIKDEFDKMLNKSLEKYETKILNYKLQNALLLLNEENERDIKLNILKVISYLIDNGAVYIVQSLNIRQIVEEKINGFALEEAEEIIISVVNKELNMITVLGGVLGFIIGFMPAIVKYL